MDIKKLLIMKISEIENKELRELAEKRRNVEERTDDELEDAFDWFLTKEGFDFWQRVDKGIITELPKTNLSKEENFKEMPNYYIGRTYGYEARKVIEDFELSYNIGNSVSYLLRAGKKKYVNNNSIDSAIADLEKTKNHIDFEIDLLKNLK